YQAISISLRRGIITPSLEYRIKTQYKYCIYIQQKGYKQCSWNSFMTKGILMVCPEQKISFWGN
ncbi:hypothetical protein ACQP3L_29460, partial [Escherichia coli]